VAAHLLVMRVRIPFKAWMSVVKCRVSSGRGLRADRSSGRVPPSVVCLIVIESNNNNPVYLQVYVEEGRLRKKERV
jgi:hypothetical protein